MIVSQSDHSVNNRQGPVTALINMPHFKGNLYGGFLACSRLNPPLSNDLCFPGFSPGRPFPRAVGLDCRSRLRYPRNSCQCRPSYRKRQKPSCRLHWPAHQIYRRKPSNRQAYSCRFDQTRYRMQHRTGITDPVYFRRYHKKEPAVRSCCKMSPGCKKDHNLTAQQHHSAQIR